MSLRRYLNLTRLQQHEKQLRTEYCLTKQHQCHRTIENPLRQVWHLYGVIPVTSNALVSKEVLQARKFLAAHFAFVCTESVYSMIVAIKVTFGSETAVAEDAG